MTQKDIIEAEFRTSGANKIQGEISQVNAEIFKLKDNNKSLKQEQARLAAQGEKSSAQYKRLSTAITDNNKKIGEEKTKLGQLNSQLKITDMSFSQLSKKAGTLSRELNNTNKSADPKKWNELQRELKETRQQMDNVSVSSKKTSSIMTTLKGLMPALGVAALAAGFKAVTSKITQTRGEFQKYEAVLAASLGSNRAANAAMADISVTAAKTNFQLADLTENFVKLANRGLVISQQEMLNMADVANATGKDMGQLSEAIMDINNPERWKEFGIKVKTEGENVSLSFKGMTQTVEKTEKGVLAAVKAFGEMEGVKGQTAAISATIEGSISNLNDTYDMLWNNLGKRSQGAISTFIKGWSGVVSTVADWVALKPSEELEKEQLGLNMLVGQLARTNEGEGDRTALIEQLKKEYPGFLEGLDTENLTTASLAKRLSEVNREYVNKIVLQEQQDEYEKRAKKEAKFKQREIEYQIALEKDLSTSIAKAGLEEAALGKSYSEQIKLIQEYNDKSGKSIGVSYANGYAFNYLVAELKQYSDSQSATVDKGKLTVEAETRKLEIMRMLGITLDDTTKKTNENKDANEEATTTIDKQKKAYDENMKAFEKMNKQRINLIKQQRNSEEIDEATYQSKLQNNELTAALARLEILKKYGEDYLTVEAEIYDKRIAMLNERDALRAEQTKLAADEAAKRGEESVKYLEEMDVLEQEGLSERLEKDKDAYNTLVDERIKQRERDEEDLVTKSQRDLELAMQFTENLGGIISGSITGNKNMMRSGLQGIINMMLDALQRQVQMSIVGITAGSLASPDSLLTFGATGFAKAAALTAVIQLGFTAVKALIAKPLSAGQAYMGRYDVLGQQDGRLYRNIPYTGEVTRSGVVNNPTLISERGGELIFDAATTRRAMNTPAFLNAMSMVGVPQRAEGNYQPAEQQINAGGETNKILMTIVERSNALLENLLVNGIDARMAYTEFEKKQARMTKIYNYGK